MITAYQPPEFTGVDLPGIDPSDSENFDETLIQQALENGYITEDQLEECFREKQAMKNLGTRQTIGQICIRREFLSNEQVKLIMRYHHYQVARREDLEIGHVVVEKDYVSQKQVDDCLQIQEKAYKQGRPTIPRLMNILGDRGVVDHHKVIEVLDFVQKLNQRANVPNDHSQVPEKWSWDQAVRRRQRRMVSRESERFGVPDAYVRYKTGFFDSFKDRGGQQAPLIDLSLTGLQFLSRKKLKIGQKVKVELMVPALTDKLILKSEVRWIGQAGLTALYRVGVRFSVLNKGTFRHLENVAGDPFMRAIGRSPYRVYW